MFGIFPFVTSLITCVFWTVNCHIVNDHICYYPAIVCTTFGNDSYTAAVDTCMDFVDKFMSLFTMATVIFHVTIFLSY